MHGRRIANLGTGIMDDDAVTVKQVNEIVRKVIAESKGAA